MVLGLVVVRRSQRGIEIIKVFFNLHVHIESGEMRRLCSPFLYQSRNATLIFEAQGINFENYFDKLFQYEELLAILGIINRTFTNV